MASCFSAYIGCQRQFLIAHRGRRQRLAPARQLRGLLRDFAFKTADLGAQIGDLRRLRGIGPHLQQLGLRGDQLNPAACRSICKPAVACNSGSITPSLIAEPAQFERGPIAPAAAPPSGQFRLRQIRWRRAAHGRTIR